jgi:hypothetical protein
MELLLIEQQVKDLIIVKAELSSNEKARRIRKTLDFIVSVYDKHQEEISVEDAYKMLFGDENVEEG